MHEIRDRNLMEYLIRQEKIKENFSRLPEMMRLLQFEKGELLTHPMKELKQFFIIIKGNVSIYGIHDNSRKFGVVSAGKGTLLGDMEFSVKEKYPFFTEATETVWCLSIPFRENRQVLENDAIFLRYVLKHMANKLAMSAKMELYPQTLEEKVLIYLEDPVSDHCICSVNEAITQLHCSRRQLQRVLKKLCEEGKIEKIGRGRYIMNSEKQIS